MGWYNIPFVLEYWRFGVFGFTGVSVGCLCCCGAGLCYLGLWGWCFRGALGCCAVLVSFDLGLYLGVLFGCILGDFVGVFVFCAL